MHPSQKDIHSWEFYGIGKAPFTLLSVIDRHGTCEVCSRAIRVNCRVRDAEGKVFGVGSSCIHKSGDLGLINKAKEEQKRRRKKKRAAQAEQERQARLEQERSRNGGLTDWELEQKELSEKEAKRLALLAEAIELLDPLARYLERQNGSFCQSIAQGFYKGTLPRGRGISLTLEILAKRKGRKNSKAYLAEYEAVESIFNQAQAIIKRANER